jgi:hypothetical protein
MKTHVHRGLWPRIRHGVRTKQRFWGLALRSRLMPTYRPGHPGLRACIGYAPRCMLTTRIYRRPNKNGFHTRYKPRPSGLGKEKAPVSRGFYRHLCHSILVPGGGRGMIRTMSRKANTLAADQTKRNAANRDLFIGSIRRAQASQPVSDVRRAVACQ